MAGMRALGRLFNTMPSASGLAISLDDCSGVGFLAVASSTSTTSLAFTAAKSYGGSYGSVTTAAGFNQPPVWYQQIGAGTAAWTKQTASWSGATLSIGGTTGNVAYVDFLGSMLADGYDYLKVTATNCTLTAIKYDLTVQRSPENLQIISA